MDLKFEQTKHQSVSKTKKKKKAKPKEKRIKSAKPDILSFNNPVYTDNQRRIDETKNIIEEDDHFVSKLSKFERYIDKKNRNLQFVTTGSSNLIDNFHLNPDLPQIDLRHQNLGMIYGRVKQKFNKQIRQGGASLKFGAYSKAINLDEILPEEIFSEQYEMA